MRRGVPKGSVVEEFLGTMQTSSFNKMNVGAVVKAKTQDKGGTPGPIRSAMPFTDVRERNNVAVCITDLEGVPVNVTVDTIYRCSRRPRAVHLLGGSHAKRIQGCGACRIPRA